MNTQYQLCFYSGSLSGKIFPIVKEETKIGRDSSCDIILIENSVSRIHLFLYVQQNGSVVLVDNNSTNGTVVNNNQISAPVQLSENDVIGLGGDVMFVFQKVAGFEPGNQWNSADMPAGNAPDSYNFEKQQGNNMNNDNVNNTNDGAVNGFAPNNGQDQQPAADTYGFNQAYNANYSSQAMSQVQPQQAPYGFNQVNSFGQNNVSGFGAPQTANQGGAMAFDNQPSGVPGALDAQKSAVDASAPSAISDPVSQQQMMGQQNQNMYASNPYSQQQPMAGAQQTFGANPYSQPMGQQPAFGTDPYSQQVNQQNPMGYNAYQFNAQMPYGNDPYAQQQMGQQMPYGNDPYAQQQMGQQMPYGNDPYAQQQMGQQMPYGSNPYAQQQGQQMPYGNNPYAQQYQGMQQQQQQKTDNPDKKKKKKLWTTLAIVLGVLLVIGIFIFIIDHNRLWCDVFPFLWDADTCANYVR